MNNLAHTTTVKEAKTCFRGQIMPCIANSFAGIATQARHTRSTMLEVIRSDYVTTAKAVVRAAEYMRDHLQAPLRSEEIARAAGFNPDYLSRKFRQATGMSMHAYLTFLRLRKASVELRKTDRSITEIALSCGFSDSNYFKDCFRQHYGCSPRAWRTLSEQL